MDQQSPDRADSVALASVALHARERQYAGHLPGAANEQRHGTAVLTPHMDLALEQQDHVLGRGAFFKESFALTGDALLAVAGQPQASSSGSP